MNKKNITSFIIASLISFSFIVDLNINNLIDVSSNKNLLYLALVIFIFKFYKKYNEKNIYFGFKLLAFLFSIFMIFGYSYDKLNSWDFVFGNNIFIIISIFKFIGFYSFFKILINLIYNFIKNIKFKNIKNKLLDKFNKKPLLYSGIIILLCWLPYIISFYPVILSPDPTNQIKQFYGIPTRYIDGINLVNEDVLITNDNPILHTLLLGGTMNIGHSIGNDNLGLFIYSIIQISILLGALLYSIKHLMKNKVPSHLIFITVIIYALVPIFPLYSMSAVKDVIFSSFMLIFVVKLYDFIRYQNISKKDYVILTLISLAVCLSRNNGIYHILLSLPFSIFFIKKEWFKIILVTVISTGIYLLFVNSLPYFQITPGNKREMYSIPFQQTARYVKYYGDELTPYERDVIDKILVLDTLAERYNPEKSDAVKNKFNALATDDEFNEYLKVWFYQFLKHPSVYLEATINNVYGYFYPNTSKWYIYYKEYNRINETGKFNYHYNNLDTGRNILVGFGQAFKKLPVIGLYVNIGFVVWIYLFMLIYLIKEKLNKYIVVLLPALSLILVCVASPVNTYFRYALPYIVSLPAVALLLYSASKKLN